MGINKKILLVFGTRPEAIKMGPLVRELKRHRGHFEVEVCVSAQHREMLDQVLSLFGIEPDYDLNVMRHGQDLYDVISAVLIGMRSVLLESNPKIVLVHGDTTTTLAASLAAYYKQTAVGHIEAGLRTNNIFSPYPEELNRQLVSRIADLHFAPTNQNRKNLEADGVSSSDIFVVGNTVIDALLEISTAIESNSYRRDKIIAFFKGKLMLDIMTKKYILITGHRRETFGHGMEQICLALREIAEINKQLEIIFPVHLNPNVRKPVSSIVTGIQNIHLIDPLDYEQFIFLMSQSEFILTDSGGIQEEAPALGKPVLVLRETTERPEVMEAETARLVGLKQENIVRETNRLLADQDLYRKMSQAHNPYGDGQACRRIVNILKQQL